MFLVPFNRDNDVVRAPWVLMAIIAANAAILLITYPSLSSHSFYEQHGFIPAHPRWEAAFASMFLHSGFLHLLGNSWFLWMFGYKLEVLWGRVLFTAFYLLSGLGALGLHMLGSPDSMTPLVGASGAISGMVGAFFILFPRANFDLDFYFGWALLKTYRTHARVATGAWFLEQAVLGVAFPRAQIAFLAHAGGFLTGALCAAGYLLLCGRKTRNALRLGRWKEPELPAPAPGLVTLNLTAGKHESKVSRK
jgi:membrane associated rhomboid family serine protease